MWLRRSKTRMQSWHQQTQVCLGNASKPRATRLALCSRHSSLQTFVRMTGRGPGAPVLVGLPESLPRGKQGAYQLVGVSEEDWLHGHRRDEGAYDQDEILLPRLCVGTGFTTEKKMY